MIYLGEQKNALQKYSEVVLCWLKIKLWGKLSSARPDGHNCGDSDCEICTRAFKRKTDLNPHFVECFSSESLREIITGDPISLVLIGEVVKRLYAVRGYSEENFNEECSKLFLKSGYENFFYRNLNYRLAEWLDIHTCAYCNRQYTLVIRKSGGEKGMVPQFDHWFAKSENPLLALSFYNLIPSCGTCNSSIKSTKILTLGEHLHPYVDKEISNSFRFSYVAKSPTEYEVICKNTDTSNPKHQQTMDALETKLLYKGHSKKELKDLIDLRYKYSENYLDILLNKTFNRLDVTKSDKYRLIFGIEIDEEKYHERPFSKFKKDIIEELISVSNAQ